MTKKTRRSKARRALLALSLVLVTMMVTVGGTIAWLTAQSNEVENIFQTSDIGVALTETQATYEMVPGHTITKDPKAQITSGSEYAWLFVKITESENFADYMDYTVDSAWTPLPDVEGVYYIEVDTDAEIGVDYPILSGNQVTVLNTVTKEDMETAKNDQPTLTFQTYACQLWKDNSNKFTAAEAWEIAGN